MGSILASLPVFQGKKPKVPTYTPLDPYAVQGETAQANLNVFPKAQELASATNTANQSELDRLLAMSIPGWKNVINNNTNTLEAYSRGEVSPGTRDRVQRDAAVKSFGSGTQGSNFAGADFARSLGLTSEGQRRYAVEKAPGFFQGVKNFATTPLFDPSFSYLQPGQAFGMKAGEQDKQFNRNWLAAQVQAAPAPWAAHLGQTLDSIADTALSMVSAYAGGGMGGGGGGSKTPTNKSAGVSSNYLPMNLGGYGYGEQMG